MACVFVAVLSAVAVVVYPHPGGLDDSSVSGNAADRVRQHATMGTPPPQDDRQVTGPLAKSGFSRGACVAQAPLAEPVHRTVFLDAGHGGPDPGAQGSLPSGRVVSEKVLTLPVVRDAAMMLRRRGYRTVVTRTADTAVSRVTARDMHGRVFSTAGDRADMIARLRCANLSGAAALVSVHFDAFGDASAGGATTLYDPVRPFARANHTLARLLQQDVLAELRSSGREVRDRGVASDTTAGGGEITARGTAYGHLALLGPADPGHIDHPSMMPGAVVEPLFVTNPSEAAFAASSAGQHLIAAGIARAVAAFCTGSGG